MAKNVQWKYQNNKVAEAVFIRGEVTQEDCLRAANGEFYIATVPAGVIIKSITVYPTGEIDTNATHGVTLDIGFDTCALCEGLEVNLNKGVSCITDSDCQCKLTDKDYLVRLTVEDDIEVGGVMVLIEVVNPNHIEDCSIEPIELKYETVIKDPCSTDDCDAGCPDAEVTVPMDA